MKSLAVRPFVAGGSSVCFKLLCSLTGFFLLFQQVVFAEPSPVSLNYASVVTKQATQESAGEESDQKQPQSFAQPQLTQDFLADNSPLHAVDALPESTSSQQRDSYESERYTFDEALEQLRPEYASALIVKNLTARDLEALTELSFETAVVVLHGEIVLFSSGNQDEIGITSSASGLLRDATFISHIHSGEYSAEGPSGNDIAGAVAAPGAEYVVTGQGVYGYNNGGLLLDGAVNSYDWYLDRLQDELRKTADEKDQAAARAALNAFIVAQDQYNQTEDSLKETFRAGGTLSYSSALKVTKVTTLPGTPTPFVTAGSSAATGLSLNGSTGILTMNYAVPVSTAYSGLTVSFDNPNTTAVETADFTKIGSAIVFGLKGSATTVSLEIVDINNVKDTFTLTGISATAERFWSLGVSSIKSVNKTKIKAMNLIVKQANTTTSARTGTLSFRSNGLNLNAPSQPVIAATVPAVTNQTTLAISGTKDANSSILINGSQAVAATASTTWTATVTLTAEGDNAFNISAQSAIGKTSAVTSLTIKKDTIAPSGAININAAPVNPGVAMAASSVDINSGSPYTASRSVTLYLSASDVGSGVAKMSFSNDNITWTTPPEAFAATKAWTLTAGDGLKTIYVKYYDNAGNVSEISSKSITLDSTAPAVNMVLNHGAPLTNSRDLAVSLTAADALSGVVEMSYAINRTDDASFSVWESFKSEFTVRLPAYEGDNWVNVRVRDKAGNITWIYNSVKLDLTAPAVTMVLNHGSPVTNSKNLAVSLTATDAFSGVADISFAINRTDDASFSAWEPFKSEFTVQLPSYEGDNWVNVRVRDKAGNITWVYNSVKLDLTAPAVTMVLNHASLITNAQDLAVLLTATDALSGLGDISYAINRTDDASFSAWESFKSDFTVHLPSYEGTNWVNVRVRDKAGNITWVYSPVILDKTPPAVTMVLNHGEAVTHTQDIAVSLTATDALSGLGDISYAINRTDDASFSAWESFKSDFTVHLPAYQGDNWVNVRIRDKAGNITWVYNSVKLDLTVPAVTMVLNHGAALTKTQDIAVSLTATGVVSNISDMSYSINSIADSSFSAWESFKTDFTVHLPAYEGDNWVNVRIRDKAGNITWVYDSVKLDKTAPAVTMILNHDEAVTSVQDIAVSLVATDALSGVVDMCYAVNRTDDASFSAWESFKPDFTVHIPAYEGDNWVNIRVRDKAGNITWVYKSVRFVKTAPPPITMVLNHGEKVTYTQDLSVSISGGTDIVDMSYAINRYDEQDFSAWEAFKRDFTVRLPAYEGDNWVNIRLRDKDGRVTWIYDSVQYYSTFTRMIEDQSMAYFDPQFGMIETASGYPFEGFNKTTYTQPTAIGLYAQTLANIISGDLKTSHMTANQAITALDKMVTSLLRDQQTLGDKGLLPFMDFNPATQTWSRKAEGSGLYKFAFGDNANLSAAFGATIGALMAPSLAGNAQVATIRANMEKFLDAQAVGYAYLFNSNVGQFRRGWCRSSSGVYSWLDNDSAYQDIFGSEFRAGIMFVTLRYNYPDTAYTKLRTLVRAYTMADDSVKSAVSTWDGGAFQMLWPLLWMPETSIPSLKHMQEDFVDVALDYANRNNMDGFLSAAFVSNLPPPWDYMGTLGIKALAQNQASGDQSVASLYTLGAAHMIRPNEIEALLKRILADHPDLMSEHGLWEGFNAKDGNFVIRQQITANVTSFILGMVGQEPAHMTRYLQSKQWNSQTLHDRYQSVAGGPIGQAKDLLNAELKLWRDGSTSPVVMPANVNWSGQATATFANRYNAATGKSELSIQGSSFDHMRMESLITSEYFSGRQVKIRYKLASATPLQLELGGAAAGIPLASTGSGYKEIILDMPTSANLNRNGSLFFTLSGGANLPIDLVIGEMSII
jgi:SH3-like domain-containing protein